MLHCNCENQGWFLTSSFAQCSAAQERLSILMGWSPTMCGGQRHGIVSALDSRQTLELNQGANVSSMTVFYGRPSIAVLPRHSMPGNICKQWPPTKELWLCRGSLLTGVDVSWDGCWPNKHQGMDADQTPASVRLALATARRVLGLVKVCPICFPPEVCSSL